MTPAGHTTRFFNNVKLQATHNIAMGKEVRTDGEGLQGL
jgi:hypothetical protein